MWFRVALLVSLLLGATPASAHEWVGFFDRDDAVLSSRGFVVAREVADYYRRDPDRSFIVIDAYLDTEEASRPGNRTDLRRARAMMLEIVRQGVSPGRLRLNVHGDTNQARPSTGAEPLNRRVVVNVRVEPDAAFPLNHSDQPYFFFASGSAEVNEDHVFSAQLAMAIMVGYEVTEVSLTAGTDRVGSAASNLRLAAARGEAIAQLFAREGVPWDRITVHGESPVVRQTADGVAEPLNRRVDAGIFRVRRGVE